MDVDDHRGGLIRREWPQVPPQDALDLLVGVHGLVRHEGLDLGPGLRLGDQDALAGTYRRMGDFLKQRCAGWDGYVFTAKEHAGRIGLKSAARIPFEHAGIDCRLLRYELYAGSTSA